jgi:hypothetical protein
MDRLIGSVVLVALVTIALAFGVAAQTPGPTIPPAAPSPTQTPVSGMSGVQTGPTPAATLDCPGSASTTAPRTPAGPAGSAAGQANPAVGTPQGTGTGSGLQSMATVEKKRVEGQIASIDSTRTNRIIEVGGVKLEVEPSTLILVDCKPASTADLKEGARVKAAYEVKNDNRNLATVIEAQK